jgi:predicted dehydrogenase
MSQVDDPRSAPGLQWGILGPGGIAGAFAAAVNEFTSGTLVAVGSRSAGRAQAFAGQYGVDRWHESYEALVDDRQVQAVYVATPHSEHLVHALLAIDAGTHVLVEKALTRNAREAQRLFDAAAARGVFAMEAMWTRFLPHVAELRDLLDRGEIGEVVGVFADHGQDMRRLPADHRLHNPALAGGALLDLGVYPVSFALDLLGTPDRVTGLGSVTKTGVDGQVSIALGFGDRAQASLHTTLWARTPTTATVFGTAGRIEVARHFYRPTTFDVVGPDGDRRPCAGQPVTGGMQYEAAEVARCIAEGRAQSQRMSWDSSLAVMRTLDELRRQVGVTYPGEVTGHGRAS